jgi:cell shape-determining protein MreC
MENIVDEFKKYAKELGVLYRTKRELDSLIEKYEEKLKKLGKNLELADSFESSFNSTSTHVANS